MLSKLTFVTALALLLAVGHACAAEYEIVNHADLVFAEHDGTKLVGDLYLPKGRSKVPVLVAVHGGGWQVGSKQTRRAPCWCSRCQSSAACRSVPKCAITLSMRRVVPDPRGDREHGRPVKIKIIIPNGPVASRVHQRQVVHAGRRARGQLPASVIKHGLVKHRLRGGEDRARAGRRRPPRPRPAPGAAPAPRPAPRATGTCSCSTRRARRRPAPSGPPRSRCRARSRRTSARTSTSCCASFCPKTAMSGRTRLNSLSTTVSTPWKNPGRNSPSRISPVGPGSTMTSCSCGYISRTLRREHQVHAAPPRRRPGPASRVRGYLSRSSFGPNWSGLTKIETATVPPGPASSRARRSSARCPSCSAPIVGTRTTGAGEFLAGGGKLGRGCVATIIGGLQARRAGARRRSALSIPAASARSAVSRASAQVGGQRGRVGRRDRRHVRGHGAAVAARDRPGQARVAEPQRVVECGAEQRAEHPVRVVRARLRAAGSPPRRRA